MIDASVILWVRRIGAVSWDEARSLGAFHYGPAFVDAGIEIAPLTTPVRDWGEHAEAAGAAPRDAARIEITFRSSLVASR